MPNNIGSVITKFTNRLDRVITQQTVTSDLSMNQDLIGEMKGNGVIEIATIAMDGLADHVRGGGFVKGGATLTWEPYKLEFERDREFDIDSMDDEERAMLLSANVMAEFARTKVAPEVDAIRFARITENAGTKAFETFTSATQAVDALDLAQECLEDYGAELSKCLLYCSSNYKTLLKKGQPWRIGQGETPNRRFDEVDGMKIRTVERARFFSAIDLLDGTTSGEEAGGYKKAEDGAPLNFIALSPEAVAAITKHEKLRYFTPDENQSDDAHKWQYRLYHDLLVYLQKKGLIYVSINGTKPTTSGTTQTQ